MWEHNPPPRYGSCASYLGFVIPPSLYLGLIYEPVLLDFSVAYFCKPVLLDFSVYFCEPVLLDFVDLASVCFDGSEFHQIILSLFIDEGAPRGGLYGWKVAFYETPGSTIYQPPQKNIKVSA